MTDAEKTIWIEALFKRKYINILYLAKKMLDNDHEAEDATQEVFIKLWKNGYHPEPEAFLVSCLNNICLNIRKHRKVVRNNHSILAKELPSFKESVENDLIKAELIQKVHDEIEKLLPIRKQIIKLIFIEGKTNQEIATLLNISDDTVRVQYMRFVQDFGTYQLPGTYFYKGKPLRQVCTERNIPYNTVTNRIRQKNISVEEALDMSVNKSGHDITYNGQIKDLKQWCQELGVAYELAYLRIFVHGWTPEKTFTTKPKEKNKPIFYKGESKSLADWCRELKLEYNKTISRLILGWSVDEVFTGIRIKKRKTSCYTRETDRALTT